MSTRVIDRFRARSDDGKYEKTIVVYQEMIDNTTMSGRGTIPGMKSAQKTDGFHCNYGEEGVFMVVYDPMHPGIVVRRVP